MATAIPTTDYDGDEPTIPSIEINAIWRKCWLRAIARAWAEEQAADDDKAAGRPVTVEVRLATRADRETLVDLFHAIDVHYWGAAAPSRAAMAPCRGGRAGLPLLRNRAGRAGEACSRAGHVRRALPRARPRRAALHERPVRARGGARPRHWSRAQGFLARLAVERGCVRFDWTAETDNTEAPRFYDRLGAGRVVQKVYYRFEGETLHRFAAGENAG